MASLIPTRPTLHAEVEEEFSLVALEMIHCDLCGDYHPPELHLAPISVFEDDDEPAAA
jgi:hypothetical protein